MKTTSSPKCRQSRQETGYIDHDGYKLVYRPQHPRANRRGYVREHWLVLEQHLGRYITKPEEVHHKNGVRDDNRLGNLELLPDKRAHQKIHKPDRFCRCGQLHFGLGLCHKHYMERVRVEGRYHTDHCESCGKPMYAYYRYENRDGKRLCRRCRWPAKKCRVCGKGPTIKGLCKNHYNMRFLVPCSKCGKLVRKSGRNHWPPICWKCRFPLKRCRVCGGRHEARGLCDKHYHQLKQGTLKG